jgi:phage tail sheath gpL-like
MAVSFNDIPNSNRVPGTYVEIGGTKALNSPGSTPHNVLIVGIRQSTGTVAAGVLKQIVGELDADPYFGSKSIIAAAARAFKRVNRTARVQAIALDENSGGTAATFTLPIVGTATADGTLRVRIGDQRVSIAVASGTTNTNAAIALDNAIDATDRMPWTAANATGTVTCTHVHKGESGNGFTVEVEAIPAGLTCTPTQPTNGATNPTMSTAIAALADERYDTIITCLTDATSVAALENEMALRWGPLVKQPGMVIGAVRGSHGTLTTYGGARNSRFSCIMGTGLSPTPPWVWAAQVAGRDAQRCDTQPNRPRNGMTLPDCEAPALTSRFDISERNLLMFDGISTFKVDQSGMVMIERLITTYQTNVAGLADTTYLSMETMRNLAHGYLEMLAVGAKYDTHLLVPDGTNVDAGVPAISPSEFKGELISWYAGRVRRGLAKDEKGFAEALIAEINAGDTERMDINLSSRLVRGLVTLAMKDSFQLF